MPLLSANRIVRAMSIAVALSATTISVRAQAANTVVWRCPGPPILYTDTLTAAEAKEKGCRAIEGMPVTVIQGPRPRAPAASVPSAARPAEAKVDPAEQRARDSDARRILEAELKREEERLAELKREYNNGEPERQGGERNYQKYLDRVADLKNSIARREADVEALKRELAKLPPPKQ